MAPWQDINTGIGGNIYYGVTGIAPNRMFTVTWCAIPMFSCTNDLHTSQIVLYEGSDKIEMFIQDKPLCITWNTGAVVQGLVDATSTNFDIVNDPILLNHEKKFFHCHGELQTIGQKYLLNNLNILTFTIPSIFQ